jgi:hypothetical protein
MVIRMTTDGRTYMRDKLNQYLEEMEPNTATVRGKAHTYNLGKPVYVWRYPEQGVQYTRLSHLKAWLKGYGLNVNQIMATVFAAHLVTHRVRTDKVHNYQCLMIPIQS